jgi:hypothetical protein
MVKTIIVSVIPHSIVRFVKARRISWVGHVERMEDSRIPKRVMREKIYTRKKGVDQR